MTAFIDEGFDSEPWEDKADYDRWEEDQVFQDKEDEDRDYLDYEGDDDIAPYD